MRILFPAALAVAALAAPGAARDRNAVPVAEPTGPARTCIRISSIRESIVRSDRVIDFRTGGRQYYRVTLPQSCPQLAAERRFAYATSLSQLCAQDVITVLYASPPMRGASCGLAPFQPVRIAKR